MRTATTTRVSAPPPFFGDGDEPAPRWGWARDLEEQFTHLYASHHSSRKLAWAPHLSTAEVVTTYLAGGEQGMRHMLRQFGPTLKLPWTKLVAPELTHLELDGRIARGPDGRLQRRA